LVFKAIHLENCRKWMKNMIHTIWMKLSDKIYRYFCCLYIADVFTFNPLSSQQHCHFTSNIIFSHAFLKTIGLDKICYSPNKKPWLNYFLDDPQITLIAAFWNLEKIIRHWVYCCGVLLAYAFFVVLFLICLFKNNLSDDVCAEMKHLNVGPNLLSQIFKRFKENRVRFIIERGCIIFVYLTQRRFRQV
jgi:hypothetical protein